MQQLPKTLAEVQVDEWKELDGFHAEEVQDRDLKEFFPNNPEMLPRDEADNSQGGS